MKKGSTLVEAIISMSLLLIALSITVQISTIATKSIRIRKDREKANRVSYAIENEIKYNISFTEIENIFTNGNISFKYKDDILDSLLNNSLLSLERGNEIVIEKKIDHSIESNYEISTFMVRIINSEGGILSEREFIKSYWMDI